MSMKFKDTIDGSISKNAATAAKLQIKRTINGTEFDGSANITTINWGTARNIYIADSSSTNKGAAISVNGSGDVTLKLPATIKASLTGNASTASSAAKLTTGRTISITGVANGSATFDGSSNITIATNPTIFSSEGTAGKQGYIEFARMTITGSYTNRPIEFTLISRGRPTSCTVSIAFMNTDNSDPGLSSIKYTGSDYGVFIQKTATSTWAVYATKSEAYDTISLVGKNYVNQSITITHPGTFITTKPTKNITDATLGGTINNSVFADKLKNARTITIGNKSNSFDGSANISYTLSEIGAAAASHGLHFISKTITTGFDTAYRAQTKGNTNSGEYLATIRNDTENIANAPQYGSGLAWGRGDTHGYLCTNYSTPQLYVGGGNENKLNWVKQVSFTDHNHDSKYAAASHGTHVTYSTTAPKVAGTASVGSETSVARGDHVHAAQTSVSGNAGTATKLQTKRTINGTEFDGSDNITTANWGTSRKINQISVNGSADVKLPLDYYTCSVGNSNAKPYHHILTTGQCTGDYTDKSITIVLVNHYNDAGFGIAKATFRTNQASTGATATGELRWLVRSGFSENSLCYNLRNTAKDAYMDVFYKSSGTYDSLTWYVLTEGR